MSERKRPNRGTNSYDQAVARFANLLESMNDAQGLNVNQVSALARVPKSTGYRHFHTLEQHQFTSRAPDGVSILGDLGWHIGFSAWGFGDVSPFAAPTLRYLRTQSRRTTFLGVLADPILQVNAYSASRGLSYRSVPGKGIYTVTCKDGPKENFLQAQDQGGKRESFLIQTISDSDFGNLVLGAITLSANDSIQLDRSGLLNDTAHRLRVALRQE